MTGKLQWLVRSAAALYFVYACGGLPRVARALDTPNVLMGIDGMTLNQAGLFVNGGTPDDGFNTFRFFAFNNQPGHIGRYKSTYLYDQNVNLADTQNFLGISHNARYHSDTPEFFNETQFSPAAPLDLTNDYFPIVDRGSFGQLFDPSEYQFEVKFKPILAADPFPVKNEAHTFRLGLDQVDGFVFDAEAGMYKRANDAFTFTVGTEAVGINDWYATAPKDADGFATYIAPLTVTANSVGKGFYYAFGDNPFRAANVVAGGGRVQNPDLTWSDANDGLDTMAFGSGPTDPSRPNSQLRVPNGVPLMSLASVGGDGATMGSNADAGRVFSIELRSALLKRITPNPIMARIDANSGLSFRFGDGLSYATTTEGADGTVAPITTPVGGLVPNYSDQISRFDQNGMTNLFIQPRTGPDPNNQGYRFFVRTTPGTESFDGSKAVVKIRARLTQPLTDPGVAQSMTVYARDLDGSDTNSDTVLGSIVIPADPKGGDEYSLPVALNQFNTSTMTTITIPLSSFTVNTSPTAGTPAAPIFTNPGDGLRTDFNLFEFGALVPNGGGLVRLEVEFMDIEVPPAGDADFNDDGKVDGLDFLTWQRGFGTAGTPTNGDANGDSLVNGDDLTIIKQKFGGPPAVAASGAVPEPATSALVALALCAGAAIRRRR